VGFGSSSEAAQAPSRCPWVSGFPETRRMVCTKRQLAAPPLRFPPLQRLPRPEQRHELAGPCISRPPAPSGSRNLLAPSSAPSLPALFHAGSALGVTLQSFHPPAQPHAVSSASPLLAFEPPSGFSLRARVHHSVQRFRLKTEGVALLGLFPSRVLTLSALARPSPVLPSCGCPLRRKRPNGLHFRVSHAESRLVSLETADPPGVCGLLVVMPV